MLPLVLDNVGKIIIERKFCDNSASNKCYLLCIYYYTNFVYIVYFVFRAFYKHWFWGYRRLKAFWCEWLFQKLLPELILFILEDISSDSCINLRKSHFNNPGGLPLLIVSYVFSLFHSNVFWVILINFLFLKTFLHFNFLENVPNVFCNVQRYYCNKTKI